jgi:cyanophycin synthetase
LPGYAYGLQTACLLVRLELVPGPIYPWLSTVNQALAEAVHNHARGALMPASSLSPPSDDSLECLLYWLDIFYRLAEVPVFESPRIQVRKGAEALLAIPSPVGAQRPMGNLMSWLIEVFDRSTRKEALTAQLEKMPEMLASLKATSPRSSNVPLFLRAAHELQIPADTIVGQTVQFGQGAHARWFDSTFTDATPQIGASLARNKIYAASVMRQAGVPVPAHALAKNEEEAVQIAESMGYPVVVKPADRDGGSGVAAGLTDAEKVRAAFDAARRKSSMILVERHVPGRDYRLAVLNGEVFQAVERVPGGVTGNGVDTIAALVDTINADPRRGVGHHAVLKRLDLDEEALALLAQEGFTVDSVPEAGYFVRLRRRANVTAGGTPVAVLPHVHPDNLKLAVRAAAALRLDIAGVDLISPDITRSWKETGAAVCEINAQPQLGFVTNEHVYAEVLSSLIAGEGRIPIVLVLGASEAADVAGDVARYLRQAGYEAAWADWKGVWINGECMVDGPVPLQTAGRMILRDRTVEAAVLSIEDAGVLKTGLPCDRYDLLIVDQPRLRFDRKIGRSRQDKILREMLAMILPACRRGIYCLDETGVRLGGLVQPSPLPWPDAPIPFETLMDQVKAHFSGENISPLVHDG